MIFIGNINLFSRIMSLPKENILAVFSRLDCLGFKTRLYVEKNHDDEDLLTKSMEVLETKFFPLSTNYDGNATFIICAVFDCIRDYMCHYCAVNAIMRLDFSLLSSLAGFPEKEN